MCRSSEPPALEAKTRNSLAVVISLHSIVNLRNCDELLQLSALIDQLIHICSRTAPGGERAMGRVSAR